MSSDRQLVAGDGTRAGSSPLPWLRAVAETDEAPPADLPAAVAEELVALWSDLASAIRRAPRRHWSVECDGLVVRIIMLSRFTGPTSGLWVPVELLSSGVYQGVLDAAGLTVSDCPAEPGNAQSGVAVNLR